MEKAVTKKTAWMIRSDGVEVPVITHVYANKEETDELLALAYFLWVNDTDSREIVSEFLDNWAYHTFANGVDTWTFEERTDNNIPKIILTAIKNAVNDYVSAKPYRIFIDDGAKYDFVRIVTEQSTLLSTAILEKDSDWEPYEIEPLDGTDLVDTLSQRFLRARYGGRYDTVPGCRDMYFRISSVGFDWFPIIRDFVINYADPIETVTIVKDFESTGCEKYYVDFNNRPYNKMPVSDFWAGNGCTNYLGKSEADSSLNVREVLANEGAVQQLRRLRMNYGRVRRMIELFKHKEETLLSDE